MKLPRLLVIASAALFLATLRAEVRCPAIFGDHMVLQRGRPGAVWGEADAGESVVVEFGGQTKTTKASPEGRWRIDLDALEASATPRVLTIRGTNTLTFSDVLVGEVWLCSGQSNMERQLGPRKGQQPLDHAEEDLPAANHPLLRLFQVTQYAKPQGKIDGLRWLPCTPETLTSSEFSAVGYYFGREIQRELNVPVGMIHSSFGGTQIEAWMPPEAFALDPALAGVREQKYFAWVKGVQPTELYQSMITPVLPFTLRGFLWYQGEANAMQAEGTIYTAKLRALIQSWRKAWGGPDAPFYFALIAPFDYSRWDKFPKLLTAEELPVFWEAQAAALSVPHTGVVVTTDLVSNVKDIHPSNKRDVGLRLSRLALANTYGRKNLLAESPRFSTAKFLADGKAELTFTFSGESLKSRDGKPLTDFVIAGEDQRFFPAVAEARADKVIVWSPEVKKPAAVRFGWHETAQPNLVNSASLPAIPFRTDRWPVVTERPKTETKEAEKTPAH